MSLVGALEAQGFREELAYRRTRRKLEMLQALVNRREPIDREVEERIEQLLDEAMAVRNDVLEGIRAYRTSICETLRRLGTLEFFYAGKDFVVSVDENDVMLGRLGQEEHADSLEKALDLPVFSDWTLFRLWCRIQRQVGHWMEDK